MNAFFIPKRRRLFALSPILILSLGACGGSGGDSTAGSSTADASISATQASALALRTTTPTSRAGASNLATTITLRASAAVQAGVGAMVTLRYNGATVGNLEVRGETPTDYLASVPAVIDGGVFDIVFTNAADAGGTVVRYLKVTSLTISNTTLMPTDTQVEFDRGDGPAAFDGQDVLPGRTTLTRSGALRFTLPSAALLAAGTGTTPTANAAPGYYVDASNGADSNTGTITSPWRTLARLSGVRLLAGQGIFLRCGAQWREGLALTATQLVDSSVVAGYGAECALRKAVVSGADNFSGGWVKTGNVWSRSLPAGTPKITQLFVEGEPMRTAQWPDAAANSRESALTGAAAASATALPLQSADATALASRDIAGATVQLRTQPWFIETRHLTALSGGILTLDQAPSYPTTADASYVLQDKLWMLDSPGEFFHDTAAQRLYLIAPAVGAPADLNAALVEGSVRDVALGVNGRTSVTLHDLAVRAARGDGLQAINTPQVQVTQIVASDNGVAGIRLAQWVKLTQGLTGPTVTNNVVAGNGQYGIMAQDVVGAALSNNKVLATGTGLHRQAGVMAGITSGPAANVTDNRIDGSGYHGIYFNTQGSNLVARNLISGYCSRLTDCGAIYTWQGRPGIQATQAATVQANRVLAVPAPVADPLTNNRAVVVGIYLDDFTRNVAVLGNLLAGVPIGVFLHNASNITVDGNHIWLPGQAALAASMDQSDGDWMTGNLFSNNEIVPLVQAQAAVGALPNFSTSQAVWFTHSLSGDAALGSGRNTFSHNNVVQLQGPVSAHALISGPAGQRYVDALGWQALNPAENAPLRPARYDTQVLTLGPELAPGGNFDNGLGAWGYYQNPSSVGFSLQALSSLTGCTGGCVKMTVGNSGDLLGSPVFTMRAGVPHVYRWTAVMPASSGATVAFPYISRTVSPWDVMADAHGFVTYGPRNAAAGETLSYQAFFVPKAAAPSAVFLELETMRVPVAFDSVSVREVTGYTAAQPPDWTAVAYAPANASRTVNCTDLGWPAGCSTIGLNGLAVPLPLTMAAGTQQLLLRADSPLKR